jgi:hypothetical protein
MDMAPLIASVVGLEGKVSWLGRDPTLGSGTPWISEWENKISYRTPHVLCTFSMEVGREICRSVAPDSDPLIESTFSERSEDWVVSEDLHQVIRANETLLDSGRLED